MEMMRHTPSSEPAVGEVGLSEHPAKNSSATSNPLRSTIPVYADLTPNSLVVQHRALRRRAQRVIEAVVLATQPVQRLVIVSLARLFCGRLDLAHLRLDHILL